MIRLLFLPFKWAVGGEIVPVAVVASWVHPITVRPVRAFPVRTRSATAEVGHVESTDYLEDTSE